MMMVLFDNVFYYMDVLNDNYLVVDVQGYFVYEIDVFLGDLQVKFKEVFGIDDLELDKWVIYIYGVL